MQLPKAQTRASQRRWSRHRHQKKNTPVLSLETLTLMNAILYSRACAGICEGDGTVEGRGNISAEDTSSELPKSMKRTVHMSPLRASTAARYQAPSTENLATHTSPGLHETLLLVPIAAAILLPIAAKRCVISSMCFSDPGTCTQKEMGEIISVIVTWPSSPAAPDSTSSDADSAARAASTSWSYFSHVRSRLLRASCHGAHTQAREREREGGKEREKEREKGGREQTQPRESERVHAPNCFQDAATLCES